MNLLLTVIASLMGLFFLFQLWIIWQSKRQVGQAAPASHHGDTVTLYFFHSPHCGPCKAMTPAIEELSGQYKVISVDVGKDLDSARTFNVRATPTVVLVKDGIIAKVLIGAQSQQKLASLFQ
jgi:thioredoxin 1